MKVLIIDNYDSFTYNLYQYVGEILEEKNTNFALDIIRNDQLTLSQIANKKYDKIIISPGPGSPGDDSYFGVCGQVILKLGKNTPIFGVCLGMQGICHYFGGKVIPAKFPMHGKISQIIHNQKNVFFTLPKEIEVMRYHSLIPELASLPNCLEITAIVKSNQIPDFEVFQNQFLDKKLNQNTLSSVEIMGLKHKKYPISGIQFHPESFATIGGKKMLENFLINNF
jgi:anthranilate synthase/aminodeoxychorismate synthase-like glutamine amidotransferase